MKRKNVRKTRLFIDNGGITAIKCPFCGYTIYCMKMSAKKDVVCVSCRKAYRIRKFKKWQVKKIKI